MFKFNNSLLPASCNGYFKSVKIIHKYNTRSLETNYFLPRFNNKSGHKLLAYQGSKLQTELPLCLENQSHFGNFQDKLKSYLLKSDNQGRK